LWEGRPSSGSSASRDLDQLAAAGEQGVERLDRLVGQRPGSGAHPLGEEGEDLGIDRVGLGELAGRLGKVAHLAGIDHHEREPGGPQCGHERGFVAAGGFEHDEGQGERLAVGDQLADSLLGIRDAAGLAARQTGKFELRFRNIDPDERHSTSGNTARVGPTLQDAGWWPTQLFGLSAEGAVRRPC
jgi:hypothetical protein